MAITFAVSAVAAETAKKPPLPWAPALASLLKKKTEQLSAPPATSQLVSATTEHALAKAAHDAFYEHRPLLLSPDAVWFTLAQGFALHVNQNAEQLRQRFVRHEGKQKLIIERPDFFLGQYNPWPEAFEAFSQQVGAQVGKLRELIAGDFSTSTPTSRAACEVLVMDTFQGYFEYVMMCGCGIPSITLLGSADDWRSVRARAALFAEYGLEPWTRALLPVLDKVAQTAAGDVDVEFWRSFFRYQSGSGPSEMTGWLTTFFPYLETAAKEIVPNPHCADWQRTFVAKDTRKGFFDFVRQPARGPSLRQLPSSLASAPVQFTDVRSSTTTALRFVAGLVGVVEHGDGGLAPEFGWGVVYDE